MRLSFFLFLIGLLCFNLFRNSTHIKERALGAGQNEIMQIAFKNKNVTFRPFNIFNVHNFIMPGKPKTVDESSKCHFLNLVREEIFLKIMSCFMGPL